MTAAKKRPPGRWKPGESGNPKGRTRGSGEVSKIRAAIAARVPELLAKLMAQPSNLGIMDEPTNDLDVETLDLLQDILGDYDGTVLLVSHDRDFIDRIATTTIAMEGKGRASAFPGGWSDYVTQRQLTADSVTFDNVKGGKAEPAKAARMSDGLSFTERKRLEDLPAIIAKLEAEISKLTDFISDPAMFTREPVKFRKASEAMSERQAVLSAAEAEWLDLADRE